MKPWGLGLPAEFEPMDAIEAAQPQLQGMASALLGLFKPAGQQGWGQLSHHSFQAGEVHRLKLGLGQSHGGRW